MQTLYRIQYSNGRELLTTLAERAQAELDRNDDARVFAVTGENL
jgi:hypothetical protein